MSELVWAEPARLVLDKLGEGIDALWAVLYAAEVGALQVAQLTGLDAEVTLTEAAWDLGEAREELEWVRPELAAHGVSIDLGPAPPDQLQDCQQALAGVLRLGLRVVRAMLRDGSDDLDTPDLLALARVTTLIDAAHLRLTGHPM